ncbi:hypothetical protein CNMCM5793_000960 [Aspergillus hiratsukae]|uniref:Reverse transcriptase Ty1/copia-type domain-containing protein n=1 Tax=Aspergillus hiratsukae TaxID=1194566 RepID=A0A8H6PAF3_9EURO|nr:hypothetical protein CNMCM5793_000960 [Aspergillus hiratsukae]
MESSSIKLSNEFVHVVWASHILSLLNPYTSTASGKYSQPDQVADDEDGEDFDDDIDQDFISVDAQPLSANSEVLRQKFLDCVCELISHTKGGKFVTAAALREKEDEVEVDIARNNGLNADDEEYLDSLKQFLAMQARELSHPAIAEYSHAFLKTTITYSSARVDAQAEDVTKLLKGTLFCSLQSSIAGAYTEDTCLLGCCSAPLQPVSTKAQMLVMQFLNFDRWRSARLTGQDPSEQRQEMVELAAATVRSPQVTRGMLQTMLPSVDSHKVIRAWRVLARPVTSLRILSQIARLLPNFQNITFTSISCPALVKLQSSQVPIIKKAWKSLGLSCGPNRGFPPALTGKNDGFRSGCCSELFTHCEIQLLTRYEAESSLVPTLPYFGCSKKTCFLCESFLKLSPLNIRTRGRHGQCHPLWAIQPCNSESARQRLKNLCEIVKQKIKERLNPRHNTPPVATKQSSAVSELKSADMSELVRQIHAAVEACHGMTTPYNMLGEYVVMSGQYGSYTGTADHEFKDMTLADFRHALDWFSTYFDDTVREIPSGGSSVLAVKVSSPLEQNSSGRNLFTSVAVDRDFPSTSDVSPLSQALGFPIRVCQLDPVDLADETSEEEKNWTNPYTQILMTEIDLESENWGKTRRYLDIHGSVLLRRLDGEDLDLAMAKHMCSYCLEVLKPFFEKALSGKISRQEVLDEVTLEKATAWKPIDAYTGDTGDTDLEDQFLNAIQEGKEVSMALMTNKEQADMELSIKLRNEGVITTPGLPFEQSQNKEIKGLIAKGMFNFIQYDPAKHAGIRIFNSRLVNEIKGKATVTPFEKSQLVVQAYNDDGKEMILTQSPTIQRASQRIIVALAPSLSGKKVSLSIRDITQAYVQSTTSLNQLILAHLPKEIKGKFPAGTIMVVRKPLYGIPEAGTHWWATYHKHHQEKLEMTTSTYDPCLLITTGKKAFGVVGMQTDDTLILGSDEFAMLEEEELAEAKFSAKPKDTLSSETPLIFNGCILTKQQGDVPVELRQKEQGKRLKLINHRFKDFKHAYMEQRARGAYIATICQPEAAFDLSVAAQHQDPTESNINALNKRITWQMKNLDRGIKYIALDLSTAKLFIFVDGSFANNKDFSSQIGYEIILANESMENDEFKITGNLIHWSSTKSKRVTRSVLASEIYGMVGGVNMAITISTTIKMFTDQLGFEKIPMIMCTDSYSLYKCLIKLRTTKEKRLMIDIMALRQSYKQREIMKIRWINGGDNPADAMTKADPNKALEKFITTKTLRVRVEGWVERR